MAYRFGSSIVFILKVKMVMSNPFPVKRFDFNAFKETVTLGKFIIKIPSFFCKSRVGNTSPCLL